MVTMYASCMPMTLRARSLQRLIPTSPVAVLTGIPRLMRMALSTLPVSIGTGMAAPTICLLTSTTPLVMQLCLGVSCSRTTPLSVMPATAPTPYGMSCSFLRLTGRTKSRPTAWVPCMRTVRSSLMTTTFTMPTGRREFTVTGFSRPLTPLRLPRCLQALRFLLPMACSPTTRSRTVPLVRILFTCSRRVMSCMLVTCGAMVFPPV